MSKSEIIKKFAKEHGIPVIDIPLSPLEEPLPEWAMKKATKDILEPLQQLITKYPHKRGNATIMEIVYLMRYSEAQFIVGTDAGNIMKLTIHELYEMYEPGEYILNELPNPKLHLR